MPKQHYFFKLIPPRPTFMEDMTEAERCLMDEHGRYFQEHFAAGRVLLFGPVMASGGAFGLGILESIASKKLGSLEKATHPSGLG